MQVKKTVKSETSTVLHITADLSELQAIKQKTLKNLAEDRIKIQGFRQGKAPLELVEKHVEPSLLQSEFLDIAINQLYVEAATNEQLRPVASPEIAVKKFVPFNTLEFDAEVESIGEVKLGNYKKINVARQPVKVTPKDVDDVIGALRKRGADRKEVTRVSASGDEVVINFKGVDAKSKEPINGADGSDYPLIIGSDTFIPGFEPHLVGMKAGDERMFTITFPKDYGVNALQNKKVDFTVKMNKVHEIVELPLNEEFFAKVGAFKTLEELKADVKKQIINERQQAETQAFENQLIAKIVADSQVAVPSVLIEEQLDRLEQEERQNLVYRGQTWQEHLKAEGVSEQEHRDRHRPQAEQAVKAGLVLSAIAEAEKIIVTPEEFEIRIQILKGQYPDPQMQAELEKSENRRDILSRMLTEKTLQKLASLNQET